MTTIDKTLADHEHYSHLWKLLRRLFMLGGSFILLVLTITVFQVGIIASVLRFWKESLVTVNLINSKPERCVFFANHNSESVQKFNVRF